MENLLHALFRHDCPEEEELVNYSHPASRALMPHRDRQRLQKHLRQCSRCTESYEEYAAIYEPDTVPEAELLHRIQGVANLIASTLDSVITPPEQVLATRGKQSHSQIYSLPYVNGEVLITLSQITTETSNFSVLHVVVGLTDRHVVGSLLHDGKEVARSEAQLPEPLMFENLEAAIYDLRLLEETLPGMDILVPGIQVGEASDQDT